MLQATLTEGFASVSFVERDMAGATLAALALTSDPNDSPLEFFGSVTPPNQPFMIYAVGTDTTGKAFQRVVPFVVAPQAVSVTPPAARILTRGALNRSQFTVKNLGTAATFAITATDDKSFVSNVNPTSLTLASGAESEVAVDLTVPENSPAGTGDTITFTAANAATGNFAVVMNTVQSAIGPSVSAVVPGTGSTSGGTLITITGTNFVNGATIAFDGTSASNVEFVDSGTLRASTPPHAAGTADATVTNPDTQAATATSAFIYIDQVPAISETGLALLAALLGMIALLTQRNCQ